MNKDEIDAVAKVAQEIVKPVYDDAFKPAAIEIGKSLGTLVGTINTVLIPIRLMVHGFKEIEENLKNKLSEKLNGVDESKIKLPPLNVVGPLLEKYKYNHDTEILSEMFISLLANSMDSDTAQNAHPAFIEIISQLSPDEGRLLKVLINAYVRPKIDIAVEDITNNGYNPVISNFMGEGFFKDLEHPEFSGLYLDNLKRLSLIDFSTNGIQTAYKNEDFYTPLTQDEVVKNIEAKIDPKVSRIKITKGCIDITNFGKAFYKAVTRNG